MNRPQHGPRDVICVDLVPCHQQQRGAAGDVVTNIMQFPIYAGQAIGGGVMRAPAGTMQHPVDPTLDHELRIFLLRQTQVGCPFLCPLKGGARIDPYVVTNPGIVQQRLV